jgi:hypothetical protein
MSWHNQHAAMMQAAASPAPSLLGLPDTALLTVLRCLAAEHDLRDLLSAANAHSTLQQLSAAALTSIAVAVKNQQQVDGLQQYLSRHTAHVQSLHLRGRYPYIMLLLDELPPGLQLRRLVLKGVRLQLLPGGGGAGVLRAGAPIKHLEIRDCEVSDTASGAAFERALSQLPQLEHVTYAHWMHPPAFPGRVLSHLQQLTSLDVTDASGDVLEHIDRVPGLLDLKVSLKIKSNNLLSGDGETTGSKLSELKLLTSLDLRAARRLALPFDTAGLANKGNLRHLRMTDAHMAGGPAGVSALLSHLQQMTQLTHLSLQRHNKLHRPGYACDGPPAAAYAALTASSTLQHLDVSHCEMPADVWQHMLPAHRQLPQLRVLETSYWGLPGRWTHADTVRLASCCPNLQELTMNTQQPMVAVVLSPLHSLAALTALEAGELDDAGFAAAAALTQLRQLTVWEQDSATHAGLLQLTQLRQLSTLETNAFQATQRASRIKVCHTSARLVGVWA